MNKRGDRSRVVTSCLTLSCQWPRGAGGAATLLLSLPPSISEHHSQPESSRLAPLISLGPSRPSGNSPNLQDFLCALEERWQITRCQAKRRMSVSCEQARTPEHIEMSVNTRLGPPGSRGRGFLPMLNNAHRVS